MSKEQVHSHSDITIRIGLDANKVPVSIEWMASDSEDQAPKPCKGILLSMFDSEHRDTYKIDLWTTAMQVIEMDKFMYQTLRGLAETYYKATQNQKLANDFQRFVQYFGEQTEILPKS